MSLKTWTNEFYKKPPSKRMTKRQAIEHSLLKWTGLLPKNLKRHYLNSVYQFGFVIDDDNERLEISEISCALCVKYAGLICKGCPLYETLGNERCDKFGQYPYRIWRNTGDPRPMIRALKKTLKALEK